MRRARRNRIDQHGGGIERLALQGVMFMNRETKERLANPKPGLIPDVFLNLADKKVCGT